MKKLIAFFLALTMAVSMAGCAGSSAADSSEKTESSAPTASSEASAPEASKPTTDPSGAEVSIPDSIDSIVCLSPAVNEVLIALGVGDSLVAYDTQSVGLEGIPADLPTLDMMQPDMETLASLKPDVLFVSNMTLYDQ